MSLPYRIRPQADDEITRAVSFYEHRRDGLGLEFFGAVRDAMCNVAKCNVRPRARESGRYRPPRIGGRRGVGGA